VKNCGSTGARTRTNTLPLSYPVISPTTFHLKPTRLHLPNSYFLIMRVKTNGLIIVVLE